MENKARIQKVLSDQGILSRRRTEELIKEGWITVNGRPAQPGHPIDIRRDIVAIDGERVWFQKKKKNYYVMLHKPRGYVTTMSDEKAAAVWLTWWQTSRCGSIRWDGWTRTVRASC